MSHKFIHVGDCHLGKKLHNIPEFEQDMRTVFIASVDKAIELEVGSYIISGDLFDNNRPTAELVTFVSGQFKRLRDADIMVQGQPGDHDKSLDEHSWISLAGAEPIKFGPVFGCEYFDDPKLVLDTVKTNPHAYSTEWLFLHGMCPQIWPYCQDKKTLDLTEDVLKNYTKLKGVLLSDIHSPMEGYINHLGFKIPVEYVGSLGVTDFSEIEKRKGIHYFDGEQLSRIQIPLPRQYFRIKLQDGEKIPDLSKEKFIEKPVLILEYATGEQRTLIKQARQLWDIGIPIEIRKSEDGAEEVTINRSELNSSDRINAALQAECKTELGFSLATELLSNPDPKAVLDNLKLTLGV